MSQTKNHAEGDAVAGGNFRCAREGCEKEGIKRCGACKQVGATVAGPFSKSGFTVSNSALYRHVQRVSVPSHAV
jgi:hypothetical protein